METQNIAKVCFKVKRILLEKIEYIAEYDDRSRHRELELMMEEWIRAFEDVYGEIVLD